jgi:hypothetical protein
MEKLYKLARKQTSYDSPQIVSPEKDIHLYVYLDDRKKLLFLFYTFLNLLLLLLLLILFNNLD